jgi:hypothetical protein
MSGSMARRWIGVLAMVLALAACATGPKPPLMSPIAATGDYGFSEVQTGEDSYNVTYTMPVQRSFLSAGQRQTDNAAARTQATDFALWRAAQLAIEHGAAGFRVLNSHADINTTVEDPYYDSYWGDPFYGSPLWHRRFRPYPFGFPPGPYVPQAFLRARVTTSVQLLQNPGPGDYDAQDVIRQLQQTYPTAEREAAARRGAPAG